MAVRSSAIFADKALLSSGWARNVRISISDGVIRGITADGKIEPGDTRASAVLPGMPNLHSHAFQRAMAGRTERRGSDQDSFWSWRELMYRFALTMDPDDVAAVAAQLYVEMLEAGFTRVGEFHYLHHDKDGHPYANIAEMAERVASAAAEAGIGLTLLPVFYAHSGFGGLPPNEGQRRFISDISRYARLLEGAAQALRGNPGAVLGIAPHSLRAATPEELAALLPMAQGLDGAGGPIHIHIAEQVKEVEDCLGMLKARPVEWLLSKLPVDARWCFIHATHMTPAETRAMAQTGAVAGLCPITEGNLGDGLFNGPDFVAAGGRFGIGSDSNVEIGLGAELRFLEYGQRLVSRARNMMTMPGSSTGRSLFEGALKGGAQALHGAGGIAIGASADLVTVKPVNSDWDIPECDALLDTLIFAPGQIQIDQVFVRGAQLVEGGRHIRHDTIARRFGMTMRKLTA